MRQETIERKKKASKNKEAVEKILKEEGIGKSISTVEKNKLILKALSNETKLEDDNDDKNENLKKKSFFIREFIFGILNQIFFRNYFNSIYFFYIIELIWYSKY